MQRELVIFDFDGTLADSGQAICQALNGVREGRGLEPFTDQHIIQAVGNGVAALIKTLMPELTDFEDFKDEFIFHYKEKQAVNTELYPGMWELLEEIVKRGKKLAIVSNKPHELLEEVVEYLGLNEFSWVGVYGAEAFAEKKPHPMPLVKVMEQANVQPSQTIMIGDALADWRAAQGAETEYVGVSYGFTKKEVLEKDGATPIVDSVSDLKDHLF